MRRENKSGLLQKLLKPKWIRLGITYNKCCVVRLTICIWLCAGRHKAVLTRVAWSALKRRRRGYLFFWLLHRRGVRQPSQMICCGGGSQNCLRRRASRILEFPGIFVKLAGKIYAKSNTFKCCEKRRKSFARKILKRKYLLYNVGDIATFLLL